MFKCINGKAKVQDYEVHSVKAVLNGCSRCCGWEIYCDMTYMVSGAEIRWCCWDLGKQEA